MWRLFPFIFGVFQLSGYWALILRIAFRCDVIRVCAGRYYDVKMVEMLRALAARTVYA